MSTLVTDGTLTAKIDRPHGIVAFAPPKPPEETLSDWAADISKLLTLVDERGDAVGRPAWSELLPLLQQLDRHHVVVAAAHAEDELRRRRRMTLHRDEQRRLALHHLRLAARQRIPTAWGESGAAPNEAIPDPTEGPVEGIDDLLRQLHEAAPSKLLDEGRGLSDRSNTRGDGRPQSAKLSASRSAGGLSPKRESPPRTAGGYGGQGHAKPRELYR